MPDIEFCIVYSRCDGAGLMKPRPDPLQLISFPSLLVSLSLNLPPLSLAYSSDMPNGRNIHEPLTLAACRQENAALRAAHKAAEDEQIRRTAIVRVKSTDHLRC